MPGGSRSSPFVSPVPYGGEESLDFGCTRSSFRADVLPQVLGRRDCENLGPNHGPELAEMDPLQPFEGIPPPESMSVPLPDLW